MRKQVLLLCSKAKMMMLRPSNRSAIIESSLKLNRIYSSFSQPQRSYFVSSTVFDSKNTLFVKRKREKLLRKSNVTSTNISSSFSSSSAFQNTPSATWPPPHRRWHYTQAAGEAFRQAQAQLEDQEEEEDEEEENVVIPVPVPAIPRKLNPDALKQRIEPLDEFWRKITTQQGQEELHRLRVGQAVPSLSHAQLKAVLELPLTISPKDTHVRRILAGLYALADSIAVAMHGNKVHYRGLLEFGNACRKNCGYCGIARGQKHVERYLMGKDEIVSVAKWAQQRGYGSLMLQSGEIRSQKRIDFVCDVVRTIREETVTQESPRGLGIALSLGELPDRYYAALHEAGAHRYLLRIETSNPELYSQLHPADHEWETRLDRIRALQRVGFQVGTGVMVGLPGQTLDDLANDILFFQKEDVDMIGLGPYVLQRGTPVGDMWLEQHPDLAQAIIARDAGSATADQLSLLEVHYAESFELTTRMLALCRILMGDINVAATTALQAINPSGREIALTRGANILMPILTPTETRTNYQLYEGKPCLDETATRCRACLEMRVSVAGKVVAYGEWGDPPHALKRQAASPSNP